MIWIDIDGVLINFIKTALKFGFKVKPNIFTGWRWRSEKGRNRFTANYPTPAEFYYIAEPQPWFKNLINSIERDRMAFITVDNSEVKQRWLQEQLRSIGIEYGHNYGFYECKDKSIYCKHPSDLLIDDNLENCRKWKAKGGVAYHFNLARKEPFKEFLKWWRLGK